MLQHLITQDTDLRMVPTDRDQLAGALEELREDLRALPADTDTARQRVLARWIGIGLLTLGDHHDARLFLRQALDLATASANTRAVIATQLNLADAYRYGGEAETADAFYRSALHTARDQHPELVDFALQHYGKHLMEQGDLATARTHVREALRLRIAKGDTGLIESTQAALARVELLLVQAEAGTAAREAGDAEATQWSRRWTSWLQSRTTARTPARWAEGFPALRDAVRSLTAHERLRPRHLCDQLFPAELLAAIVARATGLEVEQPHSGVYIAYLEEGQFLDFHVDEFGFGEANLILCLKHERPTTALTASTTVFIGPDGYRECDLEPGDCVVFDGALTPHGRTPISAGESIILISFGFRSLDQAVRTVTHLPPLPR